MSRRRLLAVAGTSVVTGLGLYTWRIEPHWLELVRRALPIRGLPGSLGGRTLVQISDLHVGPQVDSDYVVASFQRVAGLQPDIVVITGDLISLGVMPAEIASVYRHVPKGRIATLATLGNHDYGFAWSDAQQAQRVVDTVESLGVIVLRNQVHDVDGLQIVGLDELWAHRFRPQDVLPRLDPQRAAIVMSHNPDTVDLPVWDGFEGWILSGHTHGGQCKPPFLPPPLLPVNNKRYTAGEFELSGNRRLYINRGVGHLLRVRFNVRPEITVFELRAA